MNKQTHKNNNTALITGSSDRIGKEMAIYLAQNGFNIVIHYNQSKDKAEKLAQYLKSTYKVIATTIKGDLNQIKSAQKIANFMINNFTNWNLLINNASIFNKSKFMNNLDEYELNLNIHLTSPLYLSHFFCKNIFKNNIADAQIINMLDKNIARIDTKNFYYLLTKKFLAEFTKMLALEVAPTIRVNAIAPGYILPDKGSSIQEDARIIKLIPLQKIGSPKNIVQTLEFLIKNDFVNGQILSIDGGASLNHAG